MTKIYDFNYHKKDKELTDFLEFISIMLEDLQEQNNLEYWMSLQQGVMFDLYYHRTGDYHPQDPINEIVDDINNILT